MFRSHRTSEPAPRRRRRPGPFLLLALAAGWTAAIAFLLRRRHAADPDEQARRELSEQAAREAQAAGPSDGNDPEAGDDLKVVEGIGPRIERVLKDAGVSTYARLAELRPNRIETIMREAGTRRAKPDTWPQQARLAAQGKWQALRDLQASLKRGAPAP